VDEHYSDSARLQEIEIEQGRMVRRAANPLPWDQFARSTDTEEAIKWFSSPALVVPNRAFLSREHRLDFSTMRRCWRLQTEAEGRDRSIGISPGTLFIVLVVVVAFLLRGVWTYLTAE
jgi:hypothetical protein